MAACTFCSTERLIRGALSFLSSLQWNPVGSSARAVSRGPALLCCPPAHVAAASLLGSRMEVLHSSELRWFSPSKRRRNVLLETEEPPYFLLLQLAFFCWPTQSRFAFSSSFCSWPQSLASFLLCACAHSCSYTIIPIFPPCQQLPEHSLSFWGSDLPFSVSPRPRGADTAWSCSAAQPSPTRSPFPGSDLQTAAVTIVGLSDLDCESLVAVACSPLCIVRH